MSHDPACPRGLEQRGIPFKKQDAAVQNGKVNKYTLTPSIDRLYTCSTMVDYLKRMLVRAPFGRVAASIFTLPSSAYNVTRRARFYVTQHRRSCLPQPRPPRHRDVKTDLGANAAKPDPAFCFVSEAVLFPFTKGVKRSALKFLAAMGEACSPNDLVREETRAFSHQTI
jgi:hypothetical protein